ncbi:hypothetical protein TPSD3_00860 [Thioflexithrix psekupsensis]|uniref:Uncharacterized protein n=1 Tax=Thioflexithrix psekupsensis TaxID=1570016 RepID=A0A251XCI2_9GAMM|nr:hypothetical protein TPSD3_00860 [Thioflexithrix psekupsensis]
MKVLWFKEEYALMPELYPDINYDYYNPKVIFIRFFNNEVISLHPASIDIVNGFGRVDIKSDSDTWFLVAKEKDTDEWLLVNSYTNFFRVV